jgi:hypothetical protein
MEQIQALSVVAPPQTRPDRRPDKKSLNKQIPININRPEKNAQQGLT